MANNDEVRTIVGYSVDDASVQKVIASTKQVTQNVESVQAAIYKEGGSAAEVARKMADFHQAQSIAANTVAYLDAKLESERIALEGVASANAKVTASATAQNEAVEKQAQVIDVQISALTRLRDAQARIAYSNMQALPEPQLNDAGGFVNPAVSGGSRNRGSLGRAGTQLFMLPDVPISGGLSTTELSRGMILLDTAIDKVGISTPVAVAGALGLAAAGIALNAALEPGRRAAENYANAIKRVTEVTISGTSEQLETARQQVETELQTAQALRDIYQRRLEETTQRISDTFGGEGGLGLQALGAALVLNAEGVNTYKTRLEEQQALIETAQIALGLFNDATTENATAVNDATAALEANTQANAEIATRNANALAAGIESDIQFRMRALQLRRDGSSEELEVLRQQLADEQIFNRARIAQLSPLAESSAEVAAQLDRLRSRQAELTDQTQLLNAEVEPYIRSREAENIAIEKSNELLIDAKRRRDEEAQALRALLEQGRTDQNQAALDALEQEGKDRADIAKAQEAINNQLSKFADEQEKIAIAFDEAEEKARWTRAKSLESLGNKVIDDRKEAEEKAAEDGLEALREHLKRRDEITRKADLSLLDAQRTRDVVAGIRATEARDEELRKEGDKLRERLDTVDDQLVKQNKVIDKRLREQTATIEDRYKEQLAIAFNAASEATHTLNTRHDKEIAALRLAASRAEVQLQNTLNAQDVIRKRSYGVTENSEVTHQQKMISIHTVGIQKLTAAVEAEYARSIQRIQGVKGGTVAPKGIQSVAATALPTINAPAFAPLGSTYNNPFAFTTAPRSATVNNIQITTATNKREVKALSNSEARTVLGQYLED